MQGGDIWTPLANTGGKTIERTGEQLVTGLKEQVVIGRLFNAVVERWSEGKKRRAGERERFHCHVFCLHVCEGGH